MDRLLVWLANIRGLFKKNRAAWSGSPLNSMGEMFQRLRFATTATLTQARFFFSIMRIIMEIIKEARIAKPREIMVINSFALTILFYCKPGRVSIVISYKKTALGII
jgi:hypothetical protein